MRSLEVRYACPPNSSMCLVKSYPNFMCVFVSVAPVQLHCLFLVVGIHPYSLAGTHPDSTVVADFQFLY